MRKGTPKQRVYKVIFHNHGQLVEIYARSVGQGELFGFIQVEDLVFGERSSLVVDPSEEGLKNEFKGVRRFSVPIHAVVRIDEVEKEGSSRVVATAKGEGVVAPFPGPIYTPTRPEPGRR
jgi:hypothetical protein